MKEGEMYSVIKHLSTRVDRKAGTPGLDDDRKKKLYIMRSRVDLARLGFTADYTLRYSLTGFRFCNNNHGGSRGEPSDKVRCPLLFLSLPIL